MQNSREIAYEALNKTEKDGAYSNIALDFLLSKTDLDARDRSFVSNLFYGVIERKITLDYQISLYLTKPLEKLKIHVLTLLRLGAYQLLYMNKVPSSAAVNECIKIAKRRGLNYASGLINAVLRKISTNGIVMPENEDSVEYLSVKYSCPQWLIGKWLKEYGKDNTVGILSSTLGSKENYIKINTVRTNKDEVIELLKKDGIDAKSTDITHCLKVDWNGKPVETLETFKNGLFHVQDAACQLCVKALKAQKGDRVFDLCAAPGGKSYSIAEEMNNEGEVLSFDIHSHRVELIKKGAERLGLSNIKALKGDATVFNDKIGYADAVLCDVPCSGFGIIGKKPEIKYKNPDEIKGLPDIQLTILLNGAKYVKIGGRLVYSTCTLSHSENQKVCNRFLLQNKSFIPVSPFDEIRNDPYITLLPHIDKTDGFFIACFERIKEDD